MSFAFDVASARVEVVRRIRAAMLGFGAASACLAFVVADRSDWWWIGALALLLFAAALRPGAPMPAQGRLFVDATGAAAWLAGTGAGDAARPVLVERWTILGSLAWLRFRFPGGDRARQLLVLRGAHDDERWRRLRAWLVWQGRGKSVPAMHRPPPTR